MKNMKTRELVLCALFVALITVGTFVRIPVGTDVYTLQFLFTLLAGLLLGARLGALAVIAYIALGLIGVPVFASGGGPSYVLQPTFGYLLGFVLQAWVCGRQSRRVTHVTFGRLLGVNVIGMAIVYLIGISWFYIFSNFVIDARSGRRSSTAVSCRRRRISCSAWRRPSSRYAAARQGSGSCRDRNTR